MSYREKEHSGAVWTITILVAIICGLLAVVVTIRLKHEVALARQCEPYKNVTVSDLPVKCMEYFK